MPSQPKHTRLPFALLALPALAALLPAQVAPQRNPSGAASGGQPKSGDEVVELSPFTVVSEAKGYFQSNTMSGTRLNSKIEDLGQSITVMTKEQMQDFAMLNINDVFDYMASTEGTNSYSQFDTDRTGAVVDQVSLNPNNANRVRGIGNANIAFNNIQTSGRVPVDPLWMDSLELSRGPNANIFGLGNASGTVNQVPATANTSRDFTRAEIRSDSYGGWRTSLDLNRQLVKGKVAARASYANQHTGFVRKPSGEDARRLSLQLKARPFKSTTLAASWYNYKNASNRPNFTTPRDYYTDWIRAGKPAWNPVTRLVTLANGTVLGNGNVPGSTTPYTANPSFFTGGAESRSPFLIGARGESPYWTMARYTSNPSSPAGNNFSVTDPFASSASGIGLLTMGPAETYTAAQLETLANLATQLTDLRSGNAEAFVAPGASPQSQDASGDLEKIDLWVSQAAREILLSEPGTDRSQFPLRDLFASIEEKSRGLAGQIGRAHV